MACKDDDGADLSVARAKHKVRGCSHITSAAGGGGGGMANANANANANVYQRKVNKSTNWC